MPRTFLTMLVQILAFVSGNAAGYPGAPDSSFGNGGSVFLSIANKDVRAFAVASQRNGKVIVAGSSTDTAGSDFLIARYNRDGSPDTTFGSNGIVLTDFAGDFDRALAIAIQRDGRVVVAGWAIVSGTYMFALARYHDSGSLDESFDSDGKVVTGFDEITISSVTSVQALAIQPDGKIVAAGWAGLGAGTALARYNADGSLDLDFGVNGKVVTEWFGGFTGAFDVALTSDGKIVTVGYAEIPFEAAYWFAVARYEANGSPDNRFGDHGKVVTNVESPNQIFYGVAIQTDGKIVAAGGTHFPTDRFMLIRYNVDGMVDTTFGDGGVAPIGFDQLGSTASGVEIQRDGKILAIGDAGPPDEYRNRIAIARLDKNGDLDSSFGNQGKVLHAVAGPNGDCWSNAATLQHDGKIISAGLADLTPPNPNNQFDLLVSRFSNDQRHAPFDYDGDGRTDISVWRPGDGGWHIARSGSGSILSQGWGLTGDKLAPADFDGDGKTDMAVFRESDGNWYIVNSQSGTVTTIGWGLAGDLPVPADYSGDGKADMAIFRPTEAKWYRWDSDGQVHIYQWGLVGDRPAPADFDGDGVTDATVYRPTEGKWYTINSTNGFTSDFQWGIAGDMPVAGDYSGDGKADFAVYRPSDQTWYRIHTDNFSIHINNWGIPDDLPVPGDYDGDGQSDLAVFRPSNSTWYIYSSTSTIYTQPFGLTGDKPTPNAFVY